MPDKRGCFCRELIKENIFYEQATHRNYYFLLEFALQDEENTAPLCPAINQTASRNLMSEQQFFFAGVLFFIKHKGWKQMGKAVCSVLMMCLWWRAKHFMLNSGQMNTKQAFPWVTKQTDAELKEIQESLENLSKFVSSPSFSAVLQLHISPSMWKCFL